MIKVEINGVDTVREERDIYRDFVNTKGYSFCKMSQNLETSREVIRDWFAEMKYEFEGGNEAMIDYVAMKI